MLRVSAIAVVFAVLFSGARCAPTRLQKRIDQTISDATRPWQDACIAAGGTQDKCSGVAVPAFTSLLEAGGVCDQQNAADAMIDLSLQLGNEPDLIRLAQIFAQQPRNSPDKKQVPYCQIPPKNAQLNGLFHCQFAGSDFTSFSGDQTGNVPLGLKSLSPAGSCPANPDGPIADGVQLNTLVQSPFALGGNTPTVTVSNSNSTVKSVVASVSNSASAAQATSSSVSSSSNGSSACFIKA